MAYGFEDFCIQSSAIGTVNKAARDLLSELDGSKWAKHTSSYNDFEEAGDLSALDPALPVLFICRGFAGLVVKKALVLARSHSSPHSISQRVAGIIFLGTPHNDDVQIWADRMEAAIDFRHKNGRSQRATQILENLEAFVDLTKDFQQLSSQYMLIYFCNEDWIECSGATALHSNCLWSIVSQSHLRRTREHHFILTRGMTAVLSMAHVERATVGMRNVAASRKSFHTCLESERTRKSFYTGERLPSTCDWVFARNDYLEWTVADGPACMWISGVSGTGKTILSSAIVDDLFARRQQRDVIAYCFLEEGFGRDDFARHILDILFRQLLDHQAVPDSVIYSLLPEVETAGSPVPRVAFQYFLRSLLEIADYQTRIVLVIDGLDKDEWIKGVVIDEVSHVNSSRHRSNLMRCLISSRECHGYSTYGSHIRNISLNNEPDVQRDVLRFAESRLASVYPTSANAKSILTWFAKRLCSQAQGVFLWVALVIDSFHGTESLAELEKEVQSLPVTIDGLYQRLLHNIPTQEIEIVQRVFAWLTAANRPLELLELLDALTIETDAQRPPASGTLTNRILNTQCLEDEFRLICSPLIITARDNIVRFRHPSVRRHLLSGGDTGIWGISMVEAHTLLAQTCLMLVNPEEGAGSFVGALRRRPLRSREAGYASKLKSYAYTNWSFHYGVAESHSKRLVSMLHGSLSLKLHRECEDFSLHKMGRPYQIETTTLRVASYHGFTSLIRVSLEMGVSPNCEHCDLCETPLVLAAAGGHSNAVALLLQRGASTTGSIPGHGETALHLAAAYGFEETARVLLKDNAKADSDAGFLGRTPLHAAASAGKLDIIKMLMDRNVDLNIRMPISGETPLHLAASRGHLHTVKWLVEGLGTSAGEIESYDSVVQQRYYQAWTENLLIDPASTQRFKWESEAKRFAQQNLRELHSLRGRYADINTRTEEGRTALHLAASNGHVSTLQFLLQKGANFNLVDNNRYTALRLAAENGHLNAVKLLLAMGADLNEEFHQLGATLKSITKNGHDTVANLLAWHFFGLEVMGKPCEWPVLALATQSKQNVVGDAVRELELHL